jgi:hypothetical protein
VTDELRALLHAELAGERPPPLGDVVGAAIRDGRRIRRRRRATAWAVAGVLVVVALTAFAAAPPGNVPVAPGGPVAALPARTVTVRIGTQRAPAKQKKATSAAMLHLLLGLLPPGRTSHYGVAADDDLSVQLSYDGGHGPSLLRLRVAPLPPERRGGDCLQEIAVRPDGTTVQLEIVGCPGPPPLTPEQAFRIISDDRWGLTMDAALVDQGARQFPAALPEFGL